MSDKTSGLQFLHEQVSKSIKDGKKVIHEEYVLHGSKGLIFKYYHKDDKTTEKVVGGQKPDGMFFLKIKEDDKEQIVKETLSKEELLKEISKMKHLAFATAYIKSQKGGRKGSRKGSKKGSKKSSKKSSKRGSRKISRGSRKGSKRSSKRSSRK
jgi:hypothetical protein